MAEQILQAISAAYDGNLQMMDSSPIRVAATPPAHPRDRTIPLHGFARRADDQDPGRGGRHDLPITLTLTKGQAHNGCSAEDMLNTIGPEQTLLARRGAWANIKPNPASR